MMTPVLLEAILLAAMTSAPAEPWKVTPLPGPMPAPTSFGLIEVAGARLYYGLYGAGPPLLLLHGGAGNADHWAGQIAAFAAHFQVVVLDTRGHGRSTRDARPFSYALLADDVVAVLNALRLPRASFVGWSDGGAVALDLAVRHPERVDKVVAFATNFTVAGLQPSGGAATFAAYLQRCARDHARLSPQPRGFQALQQALRPMWSTQPAFTPAQLGSIRAPVLVLDGDHDEILRAAHVRELARLVPGARLTWLEGASHFAHFQRPQAFNEVVLGFLR